MASSMSASIEQINWKELGVLTEETTFNEILIIYIFSTLGFILFYYVVKMYFSSFMMAVLGKDSHYFGLQEKAKREYYSRVVADLHSAISAPLSTYVCFYCCDDPNENIFSSTECLLKPHRLQVIVIAISTGYVTYDTFICIKELDYTLKSGGDFIAHHIVGIIGALAVLVAGRSNVALSAGNLVSEWTSFVMNQRWRMLKHKQTEGLPFLAVNALFFMSYIICRIVFMGTLLLRNY